MTAQRPPTARRSRATGSAVRQLTQLVVHRDTQGLEDPLGRVALAPHRGRDGGRDTSASWTVEVRGRAVTTARAIRPDRRPSPFSRKRAASAASGSSLTNWAAVGPVDWSIRMSMAASLRKEKPRSAWSSWGELTPRSNSTPESGPAVASPSAEKGACTSRDPVAEGRQPWPRRPRGPRDHGRVR